MDANCLLGGSYRVGGANGIVTPQSIPEMICLVYLGNNYNDDFLCIKFVYKLMIFQVGGTVAMVVVLKEKFGFSFRNYLCIERVNIVMSTQ